VAASGVADQFCANLKTMGEKCTKMFIMRSLVVNEIGKFALNEQRLEIPHAIKCYKVGEPYSVKISAHTVRLF
jgi:hypothetical protein